MLSVEYCNPRKQRRTSQEDSREEARVSTIDKQVSFGDKSALATTVEEPHRW